MDGDGVGRCERGVTWAGRAEGQEPGVWDPGLGISEASALVPCALGNTPSLWKPLFFLCKQVPHSAMSTLLVPESS